MLSGNGRHRRPRQAPALLVAAGVTGSAIAIPLLGAASASAADGTTWDKVAQCESGGSWSADTGNGYYGGLQISQEYWDKYGGLDYADSPELASRSQQIAVAEKILDDKGTEPWATCALLSGLTSHSGSLDVDTGVGSGSPGSDGSSGDSGSSGSSDDSSNSSGSPGSPDSPDSPDSSDSSGSADSSATSGSSSAHADAGKGADGKGADGKGDSSDSSGSADDSDASAKSDKSASSGSSASNESNESSESNDSKESANSDSPGGPDGSDGRGNSPQGAGSWSLVDTGSVGSGRHRGASAKVSADESEANGRSATSSGRHASQRYTVRSGDTLVSIADSLDLDGGWHALYAANKVVVGPDPDDIAPGQTLDVTTETGEK